MRNPWQRRAIQRRAISQREVLRRALPYGLAHAGAVAYRAGLGQETCPYPKGSAEAKAWLAGWVWQSDKKKECEQRWKGAVHLL